MALTGGLPYRNVVPYVVTQVVGGCLGTLAAHGMEPSTRRPSA